VTVVAERTPDDVADRDPEDASRSVEETVTVVVSGVSELSANQFAVRQDGALQKSPVISDGSQYQILLNPGVGALSNTDNTNDKFGQGDSATLDIVSPAGATTSVELRAPDLFNKNGEAVRL